MPSVDDRFRVTIQMTVEKKLPDGTYRSFSRTTQEYEHMNYEFMQQTQSVAVQAMVAALIPLGDQAAEEIAAARTATR
jgi:hypothetical protein